MLEPQNALERMTLREFPAAECVQTWDGRFAVRAPGVPYIAHGDTPRTAWEAASGIRKEDRAVSA